MLGRKLVVLFLIFAFLLVVGISGCGSTKKPETSTPSTEEGSEPDDIEGTEVPEEELEFVELVWYQVGTVPNRLDEVLEEVNKYLKEKLNVNIDLRFTEAGADYNEKMNVIINSGEYYDICFTSNWAANYFHLASKGAFVALNDLLPKYGPDLLKIISPDIWEGTKVKGKNYAVPVLKDMAELAVLNVNVKYAEKYGIDYKKLGEGIDKVSEALEIVSQEIKEDPDFIPLIKYPVGGAHGQTALPYQQIIWPFGIRWDPNKPNDPNQSYEVINILETPELAELLDVIHDWNKKGYFNRDLMSPEEGQRDFYADGKWFLDWYGYFPYHEYTQSQSLGYKVDVVPLTPQKKTTQSISGAMHAISVVSKHPERALMFLNLLNSDPVLRNMIGYGIEGVHYDLVNGKVSYGNRTPEERYNPWNIMLGNNTLLKILENEPDDKWEFFNNYNNNAVISPILGFYPDTTEIETEIAAINNVINEYQTYLWNGVLDPKEYLPKYIQKVKEAGGEKIINEIQSQLNDWLATRK